MSDHQQRNERSKGGEMELEEAVEKVLHCLAPADPSLMRQTSSSSGVFDSSLLSGVPVGDGNMNDVIGSSGTSLAQSALHNSINNYESLVGSPQKLTTLQPMGLEHGDDSMLDENLEGGLNDSIDESELIQWCMEGEDEDEEDLEGSFMEEDQQQDINMYQSAESNVQSTSAQGSYQMQTQPIIYSDSASNGQSASRHESYQHPGKQVQVDHDPERYIECDSGMRIDRQLLENLVTGKSVPDVTQFLVAPPPSKPEPDEQDPSDSLGFHSWQQEDEVDEPTETKFNRKSTVMSGKGGGIGRNVKKGLQGLPEHLKGLLGQANLFRARGNDEEALKLGLEIIRQCPNVTEPYFTVAAIYEANGDEEKAMQFYTIATHLGNTDVLVYEKLIDYNLRKLSKYEERSEVWLEVLSEIVRCCSKAIVDCTRALAFDPTLQESLDRFALIRLQCQQKLIESGQDKSAMKRYLLIVKDRIDSESYSEMAHEVVQGFFQCKESMRSLEVLENLRVFHPAYCDIGDLNILLELLIAAKMYGRCVVVVCRMFSVQLTTVESNVEANENTANSYLELEELDKKEFVGLKLKIADIPLPKFKSIFIPEDIHIDIEVKLAVALIHTENEHMISGIVEELFGQENLEDILDMFMDLCEALREKDKWAEEFAIWNRLAQLPTFINSTDVLFKLSECYHHLGDTRTAIDMYERVLHIDHNHVKSRLNLATYYKDNVYDSARALQYLQVPDSCSDVVKTDERIVSMRLEIQEASSEEHFFRTVYDIFTYVFSTTRYSKAAVSPSKNNRSSPTKSSGQLYEDDTEDDAQVDQMNEEDDISPFERRRMIKLKVRSVHEQARKRLNVSWDKFAKAVVIGLKLGWKRDVLYLVVTAASFNAYQHRFRDIQLFACRLGIEMKMGRSVYYCAKTLLQVTQCVSTQTWGLFNIVGGLLGDSRPHKFLVHMYKTSNKINNFYKSLFLALSSLESGSYKIALAELSLHFTEQEQNPLYNFLLGILYLHSGSQRFSKQKGTLFTLSIFFLKRYHALRNNPQESFYNIGRAFHQIELYPQAIDYYKKSLSCKPLEAENSSKAYSTEMYTAHNLSRIYLNSGAKVPALKLLKQYAL